MNFQHFRCQNNGIIKRNEVEQIEGPLWNKVIDAIGPEEGAYALDIWKKLLGVVEKGEHRPGNFRAMKI